MINTHVASIHVILLDKNVFETNVVIIFMLPMTLRETRMSLFLMTAKIYSYHKDLLIILVAVVSVSTFCHNKGLSIEFTHTDNITFNTYEDIVTKRW